MRRMSKFRLCRSRAMPDLTADIIIENARILTMDEGLPRADALAIRGNRILSVGARGDMGGLKAGHTRVIDAAGATVLPGLIESHMHLFPGAVLLTRLNLAGITGFDAVAAAIRQRAAEEPGDGLLMVEQAHYGTFGEGVSITRQVLDAVLPDRPLALMAGDHHTVWANTLALKAAGLLQGLALPPGNEVVMGADGLASGELREFLAFDPVVALTPTGGRESLGLATGRWPKTPATPAERAADKALLKRGLHHLARHGFTSFHAFDGDPYQYELLAELEAEGALTVRARYPFRILPGMDMAEFALAEEWRRTCNSAFLKVDFIKMFMDGVLESTTAAMLDDYCGHPGVKGECLFEAGEYDALCIEADRRGFQIAVHAIGDLAVRRTLDGYEAARRAHGARDARHRVEHIETLDPADIGRFADMGVIASFQPTHAPGGAYPLEPLATLIGRERMRTAYAWQTLRDTGARLAFSSDWPVAPIDAMLGVKTAMTRAQAFDGAPDQRQGLMDTLASFTRDNAFAAFEETEKGMLKPGMLADVTVLSGDIEAMQAEAIDTLKAAFTICDGRVTFEG
jgi:predicted amidohydrolase YtcJ